MVRRVRDGRLGEGEADALAAEEPLELRLNGRSLVVTMRTPGHDDDLARGFLVSEGIVSHRARVVLATVRNPLDAAHDNIINARVEHEDILRAPSSRSFHASSACGVCGQASLEDMARTFPRVDSDATVPAAMLSGWPAVMRAHQALFDATGGLHAAALFAIDGQLLCLREDVGRHNAVDKVVGWAAREGALPLSQTVLLVSGRAGYEIVQKSVAAGIPLVAAVGAPSSLAARLAEEAGVTLAGFLKEGSFNIYAHPRRIRA